ncbi:RNA-directed DNA polymerase [Amycolatopsis sp. OK19-0408]|uniref:RNA-directed DNA polymerase n=1 Tax=Amycolatopsis iheyensis TaxID=2945988 RepID=A0A9X2SGJ4_9PSEU|nr:RNA-directed DNA polymerase [Amycolatopsis iheyensis]MCR6481434.1 RNA-directed DNA polymerase [Amycolatopsis iheyensis]
MRAEKWASLVRRLNASGACQVYSIDVPKENFGVRPAVVMEPLDRLMYQSLVDFQRFNLINDLDYWVYGWRLPRQDSHGKNYLTNKVEWAGYRVALSNLAEFSPVGLKTDVTSCFASIPMGGLVKDLRRHGVAGDALERLIDLLVELDQTPGRSGLMQRSKSSSVLANMYLRRLDKPLHEYYEKLPKRGFKRALSGRGGVVRWMDDIWVFGLDEATLRGVQVELEGVAHGAKLELNMGKTVVKANEDLVAAVRKIQHSAVDDALDSDPTDWQPLEELLDGIIDDPTQADRTTIRFALHRMRTHEISSRRDRLTSAVSMMPHAADHVARAYRHLGWWRSMREWYLEYKKGPWAHFEWSVARLGAMFPTQARISLRMRTAFAETLHERPSLPLMALTAQRLAFWDPDLAREVIYELLPRVDHPHERRILALSLLRTGDERRLIRRSLSDFEENALTLRMIEKNRFDPFAVSPDFRADDDD